MMQISRKKIHVDYCHLNMYTLESIKSIQLFEIQLNNS